MRKHYLDNIRWATVLLVVLYHAIFMYNHVVTAGVVGSVTDCRWQDALQYLLYPWFMVVLFLVSGASARYALDSRSGKVFFAERTRKLLVPSTLGLLVLGWAQGYFNMAFSHVFENILSGVPAPVLYLILTVSGIGVLWTCHVLWSVPWYCWPCAASSAGGCWQNVRRSPAGPSQRWVWPPGCRPRC